MRFVETELKGIILVEPDVHKDPRGFFLETYHAKKYADGGITGPFVQDNYSYSVQGTLRGLHYQLKYSQGKLVTVFDGTVYDVAVDIRRGSPTFGKWLGVELSAENKRQLYIPPGFAHGFCTLSKTAGFAYKCTHFYVPEDERGIIWNDPTIQIAWPVAEPLLSAKDQSYKCLAEISAEDLPFYRG
ncbi:MAG: dTDP-4-dehydrorhamnose 3,5-epimerase [Nitrospiraceae bacterium]